MLQGALQELHSTTGRVPDVFSSSTVCSALSDDLLNRPPPVVRCALVQGTCQELEKSYFRLTSTPDPATVRYATACGTASAAATLLRLPRLGRRCRRRRGVSWGAVGLHPRSVAPLPGPVCTLAPRLSAAPPPCPCLHPCSLALRSATSLPPFWAGRPLGLATGPGTASGPASGPGLASRCPIKAAPCALAPAGRSRCCGGRWSGWWGSCAAGRWATSTPWTSSRQAAFFSFQVLFYSVKLFTFELS